MIRLTIQYVMKSYFSSLSLLVSSNLDFPFSIASLLKLWMLSVQCVHAHSQTRKNNLYRILLFRKRKINTEEIPWYVPEMLQQIMMILLFSSCMHFIFTWWNLMNFSLIFYTIFRVNVFILVFFIPIFCFLACIAHFAFCLFNNVTVLVSTNEKKQFEVELMNFGWVALFKCFPFIARLTNLLHLQQERCSSKRASLVVTVFFFLSFCLLSQSMFMCFLLLFRLVVCFFGVCKAFLFLHNS